MSFFRHWRNLVKPEYVFRPTQIVRRCRYRFLSRKNEPLEVSTPWHTALQVNPNEAIGISLLKLGIYELAVSEALWRLTGVGSQCLDIGSNIGYMTGLLSARAGPNGRVQAFEPHPEVFKRLSANVAGWGKPRPGPLTAPITLYPCALGAGDGCGELIEPGGFHLNEGIATLHAESPSGAPPMRKLQVRVRALDSLFSAGADFKVAKLDVEGGELGVLKGGDRLLSGHRIRDLVYEDSQTFPSGCARFLQDRGYRIFRLGRKLFGPVLSAADHVDGRLRTAPWEPVSYIATTDVDRLLKLMRPSGWDVLRAVS